MNEKTMKVADNKHLCLLQKKIVAYIKNSKHILQNILNMFFILLQNHSLY